MADYRMKDGDYIVAYKGLERCVFTAKDLTRLHGVVSAQFVPRQAFLNGKMYSIVRGNREYRIWPELQR